MAPSIFEQRAVMQKILLLLFFVNLVITCCSQSVALKGRIIDSASGKGLAYATVSLVKAADSTLVTFSRADSAGHFLFNKIDHGNYLLAASYVGYASTWVPVVIISATIQDAGIIHMHNISSLKEVTVSEKRSPVTINNDTLEFNTENFKTQPNAVVEDMLKKMPGVTVENDGSIKVNGQTVRRVMVNSKAFFTGDPRMATKNLSADAVDKVQVYDKKSDQSEFTGIDDGNREQTINLKLKKDKAHAVFGKLAAATGNHDKYDAQANINRFNGQEQLSFLGMGNNTNRQGFTLEDALNFSGELARGMRNGGGISIRVGDNENISLPVTGLGQNQQGIADTWAGGANYSNTWNKPGSDANMSYTASDIRLSTDKQTYTQNLLPQQPFTQADNSNSTKEVSQHRINMMLDQKIDSFTSLKITPSVTFQRNQATSNTSTQTRNSTQQLLNDGYAYLFSRSGAFDFSANMLLRRKFVKKGRTLSLQVNSQYNNSNDEANQQARYTFYSSFQNPLDSVINQRNSRNASTQSTGGNLVYTEPLGKRSLLELSTYYNISTGETDKKTFDFNEANSKYDMPDSLLSNHFKSSYRYGGTGIRYRANRGKASFSAGLQYQRASLEAINYNYNNIIKQSFNDLLPNLSYQYQFSKMKTLRFDYSTAVTQPSVTQLQPVADISNPLNVTIGNPDLRRQYNHNLLLNYFSASMATRKNLFLLLNLNVTESAVASATTIGNDGTRTTMPVNTNGVYNITGNINYGFPLKKLQSRLELESNISYNHNISFINNDRNITKSLVLGPRINYNFDIDTIISLQLAARITYNSVQYSLQPGFNNTYLQHTYSVDITRYLPAGLIINSQFNYIFNAGRADGFNTNIPLWNVSLAKSFLRNRRAEIKLTILDLLNKNLGITRSVQQSYIVDQRYNVLTRYFLVGLTYSLNKSGLRSGPRAVLRRIGGE